MTTRDVPAEPLHGAQLAGAVHRLILRHPEKHDQDQWMRRKDTQQLCVTVGCVAGWAAVLAHPELRPNWGIYTSASCLTDEYGTLYDVEELAREALVLTADEADWLFYARRTRREVLGALLRRSRGQNVMTKAAREEYEEYNR